jgi:hypothetical protein
MENSLKYRIWETSVSLLVAYESLALAYKRSISLRETLEIEDGEIKKIEAPDPDYANYNHSFALLILNASIIEGTLRSIISERLTLDIDVATEEGKKQGKTAPSKAEQLTYKFRDEVELQGGWENLKNQYAFYFDISLDKITDEKTKEAINALFILRNILAHGTAIIQPSKAMEDDMRDVYPYTWQRKIQRAHVYLKSVFGHEGVFENLASHNLPEHFIEVTKKYVADIARAIDPLPERARKTIKMIEDFSFGYINFSR